MDPQAYYDALIAKGTDPAAAAQMVQAQFPDWQGAPSTYNPTDPDAGSAPDPGAQAPSGGIQTDAPAQQGGAWDPPTRTDAEYLKVYKQVQAALMQGGWNQENSGGINYWTGKILNADAEGRQPSYFFTRMAAGPNNQGQWTGEPPGGFDGGVDPTYLRPFTAQDVGDQGVPAFEGDPGDFVRPTGDTIKEDPSYLFRRDQAVDVMTKGLAAQGLYHSGGTPHDITRLASNFAGTEYNNIFNRDAGIWESKWQHALAKNPQILQRYLTARDTFYANQNNPFAKLRDIASIGANTAAIAG